MFSSVARRGAEWGSATAAFLFALLGIGWGLPNATRLFPLHPDEAVNRLAANSVNPFAGDFVANFYNYGTLYLDATRVLGDLGEGLGIGPYLPNRLLSVFAFAMCAAAAAALARRAAPDTIAPWIAGVSVALAPGALVHARFATVDVLASAFAAWSLVLFSSVASRRRLVIGTVLAAAATACKYNLAVVVFAAEIPIFFRTAGEDSRPNFVTETLLVAGVFAFTFLALVPGVILAPEAFWRDFLFELRKSGQGQGLVFAGTAPGFLYQLGNLAVGFGSAAVAIGLVGIVGGVRRREGWALAVAVFAGSYFLLIGRAEVKYFRYAIPLVPPLAAGFGVAASRLAERSRRPGVGVALAALAIGLEPAGGLRRAISLTAAMAGTDPRDAAGSYMRSLPAPKTTGLATDPWYWSASLYPEVAAPRFFGPERIFGWMAAATNPRVVRYVPTEGLASRSDFDARLLTETKPEYVVATTLEIAAAARLARTTREVGAEATAYGAAYRRFNAELERRYIVVRVFGDPSPLVEDLEYVKPAVLIWKRRSP